MTDLIEELDGLTIKEAITTLLNFPMNNTINKSWEGDNYGHGEYELIIQEEDEECN